MGLSDKTQKSTKTDTGTATESVPDTPDIIAARAGKAQIDPSIGARLGEKERQLQDSFQNPLGGYTTPQIKDAVLRSGQRDLMQQAGEQTREGAYDVNRLNQSKDLGLAALTKGTNQSFNSSSTGKVTQSDSPLGTAAAVGGQLAPLSL